MKVNEVLNESEKKPLPDFLLVLKGKKMSWDEMTAYLDKQTAHLEKTGAMSYRVKNTEELKAAQVMSKLRQAGDASCRISKGLKAGTFFLDFDDSVPVKAKVMFDQTGDKDQVRKNKDKCYKMSTGTGGAKGYFLDNAQLLPAMYHVYGVFEEGPEKGEPFSVEAKGNEGFKKGDIITVKFERTYGNVKMVK